MKLFFVTPPKPYTQPQNILNTTTQQCREDAPEADDTVSRAADQLLLVRAQTHRPYSVLVRVVSTEETQSHLRDRVREYTALKLDSLLLCVCGEFWVWDLGFVWSSDVRQTWLVVFS